MEDKDRAVFSDDEVEKKKREKDRMRYEGESNEEENGKENEDENKIDEGTNITLLEEEISNKGFTRARRRREKNKKKKSRNKQVNSSEDETQTDEDILSEDEGEIEIRKTYAQVTQVAKTVQERKTTANTKMEWKKPTNSINEVVVKGKDEKDKQVMRKIKSKLTSEELGSSGLKAVRELKNGLIILQCESEEQKRKVYDKLSKEKDLEAREGRKYKPKVRVTE
ncbi:DNA ligase 1-like [Sitophilus oryzae]|uniref:DNA ligase 1-like n=1 Tax=Sitophilus oryzae TaxID=7048 RepID=A0A6J2Y7T8_SITOR|nr:DNA ligase 1-like [Sitophilus oryzae]